MNNIEAFKDRITVESDVPLYRQLVEVISSCIREGVYKEGDIIPSEHEFCSLLDVSRSTVRQAIGMLEEQGLVRRRRGLGTYITKPKVTRQLSAAYSFSKDMKELGYVPASRIVGFDIIDQDDVSDAVFSLPDYNRKVYKIVRVRCADNEPLLLETTYIPCYINELITRERLEVESLYSILEEESMIRPFNAEETYEAVLIDSESAQYLECEDGAAGFYIQRVTQDSQGRVYELTRSLTRGDRTKFAVLFNGDSVELNRNYCK